MTERQPIATAPKDGTKILLFKETWVAFPIGCWAQVLGMEEEGTKQWIVDGAASLMITGDDDGVLWEPKDISCIERIAWPKRGRTDHAVPTHWMPYQPPESRVNHD